MSVLSHHQQAKNDRRSPDLNGMYDTVIGLVGRRASVQCLHANVRISE